MAADSQLEFQSALTKMAARFNAAAQGLFKFSGLEIHQRHSGVYGSSMAKPSKRSQTTLSIDREVLILYSPYGEQQTRTIKVAAELIALSQGRLEPTLAVIVHKDKEGNRKLTKWGRDVGLAVLPVFINECPTKPEDLERLLAHELFSHDPFDVTAPVSDDQNFYGRKNEAQDLARKLQSSQIRACFGIRKIGKTSVINRVIEQAQKHHTCYCVMLDCSRDEIWSLDAPSLLNGLLEGVERAVADPMRYAVVSAPESSPSSINEAAARLQSVVNRSENPIVIFVDEVDYITPGSPTAPHWRTEFNPFWRNFRAIYQECCRQKRDVSMLISGVSSKWFSVESIEGIENAALALVPEEYLNPLGRGAGVSMIKKMARAAGLVFNDETAALISETCSDMPFWIRKACSYMHRYIDIAERPLVLSKQRTREFMKAFIASEGSTIAQLAVRHLFRVYAELEEPCLRYLLEEVPAVNQTHTNILSKYGIIAPDSSAISGEMMLEGLRLYLDQRTAGAGLPMADAASSDVPTKAEANLGQWADDLAVINKSRNVLEKQLRHIVVNVIRADIMSNKRKESAKTRLLAIVPSEGRHKFDNETADQIVEGFNWSQLTGLIVKEWSLFQVMFADRKQFEQQSAIINDRFDAHAKDFDPADFALYRRGLKWLSERVAAV